MHGNTWGYPKKTSADFIQITTFLGSKWFIWRLGSLCQIRSLQAGWIQFHSLQFRVPICHHPIAYFVSFANQQPLYVSCCCWLTTAFSSRLHILNISICANCKNYALEIGVRIWNLPSNVMSQSCIICQSLLLIAFM
jgi:hypothetical protein